MKRLSFLLIIVTLSLVLIVSPYVSIPHASSNKSLVVITISPLYLIAKEVVGDKAEIHVLAPAGVDPHHYSPTPKDRVLVESCDLFICTGREEFLGALPETTRKKLSWDDWIAEARVENENPHYLWLYPDNARVIARKIAKAMSELDPLNSDYYEGRVREFCGKLEDLKVWLRDINDVVKLEGKRVVLAADHFEPLAEWLGLNIVYVIIKGEGLPGPQDISNAMEKARGSALIIVSVTQSEGDEGRIARQVSEASGTRIAYLYGIPMSMNDDYISFIKRNIIIIATYLMEHQPMTPSGSHMNIFVVSTIALAVLAIVEAVLILRLKTR